MGSTASGMKKEATTTYMSDRPWLGREQQVALSIVPCSWLSDLDEGQFTGRVIDTQYYSLRRGRDDAHTNGGGGGFVLGASDNKLSIRKPKNERNCSCELRDWGDRDGVQAQDA
jgi:hypothetical protein